MNYQHIMCLLELSLFFLRWLDAREVYFYSLNLQKYNSSDSILCNSNLIAIHGQV